jgi:hypothetical protein
VRLFDDVARTDFAPADLAEPQFTFLNNAAGACWQAVRDEIESWFARFPPEHQEHLCTRFQSKLDAHHLAAFWELYLHELFSRLGFWVRVHPFRDKRSPDFLLMRGGESFYLEAVTVMDSKQESDKSKLWAQIIDAINKRVRSDSFRVAVHPLRQGTHTPPLAKIANDLQAWLDELSTEQVELVSTLSGWQQWPVKVQPYQDWILEFRAIPNPGRRSRTRVVAMHGPAEVILATDSKSIKQEIEQKASSYGRLDKPYVVALLCARWSATDDDIARALFGFAWQYPDMLRVGQLSDPFRVPDHEGAWLGRGGPKGARVSAVLSAIRLEPFSIAHVEPLLWHNPWAAYPLSTDLPFGSIRVNSDTGRLESYDLTRPTYRIFGLPPDWPPGPCFA